MQRGDLNGTWDGITTLAMEQDWSLDALGNWAGYNYDSDGDATDDLVQTRTHNAANEISGISESTGSSWIDPVNDNAGNMTEAPTPGDETTKQKYIYDAWNRLVEVQDASSNTLWTYEYDGRGRRIVKNDIASDPDVAWDSYYTQEWQLLEVRKDADTDPYQQFVWGVNYVDSLIVQFLDSDTDGTLEATTYALQDANFNVTALVDTSGDEVERYTYQPYGQPTVLDPDFIADGDGESDFDNPILFAGYVYDAESNLYHVRNRHYHPSLGRWVQRDPLGYINGLQLYQYASSSPIVKRDPFGLDDKKPWWYWAAKAIAEAAKYLVPSSEVSAGPEMAEHVNRIVPAIEYRRNIIENADNIIKGEPELDPDQIRLKAAAQGRNRLTQEEQDILHGDQAAPPPDLGERIEKENRSREASPPPSDAGPPNDASDADSDDDDSNTDPNEEDGDDT